MGDNITKSMPRFDGTGPLGYGPGTGWGIGPCGAGMAWRMGFGRGGAGGIGWRRFFTRKEESGVLKEEVEALESELKAIKERLAELERQE